MRSIVTGRRAQHDKIKAFSQHLQGEPASDVSTTCLFLTDQKALTLPSCALAKLAFCIPLTPHHRSIADTRERECSSQRGCPRQPPCLFEPGRIDIQSPLAQLDSYRAGSCNSLGLSVHICADPPDTTPAENCRNLAAFMVVLIVDHAAALVRSYGWPKPHCADYVTA